MFEKISNVYRRRQLGVERSPVFSILKVCVHTLPQRAAILTRIDARES